LNDSSIDCFIDSLIDKGEKGKGLDTCYSAAYETQTAALYNLRSGS